MSSRRSGSLARWIISLAAGCALPTAAAAQCVTLQNDSFTSGTAGFQAGFVTGEMGASVFDPSGPFPAQVYQVLFLFGGASGTRDIILHVWNDTGLTDPGSEIFQGAYSVTASDANFQLIDLSGDNVFVNGSFRVGIEMTQSGAPSIARDDDGTIAMTKNFLYAQIAPGSFFWFPSSTLGLTGDWILRACVAGTTTDAVPSSALPGLSVSPNPFSTATAVRFVTPDARAGSVIIYDVAGRAIRTLLEGPLGAGSHSLAWDGRDEGGVAVPSGVYFLRVRAGNEARTERVVRVRD